MSRLPRDLSGADLIKALRKRGYEVERQVGSHIRIKTEQKGVHLVTVPNHSPLKLGTLSGILADVAAHFKISKEILISELF